MKSALARTRAALAGSALIGTVLWLGPPASADPEDLEPYCDGGQTPTTGECLPRPDSVDIEDAPGADPTVPLGVDPETAPAI